MQTQNISFCDNIGLNIKSNDIKQIILSDLDEIKIIEKHHETFDMEKHDRRLKKVPHLLSIRSNGNPYYMYFTRINFTNTIVMIDKKIQMGYAYPRMIITRLMFHDDMLFDNTLLEGEMIKDDDAKWLYLISDLLVYKNKSIIDLDLVKRLNTLNTLMDTHYVPSYHDIFSIQIKKYVPLNQAVEFHDEFIKSLNYSCRGLYFKPIYRKFRDILFNFDIEKITQNNNNNKQLKHKSNFVTNDTSTTNPSTNESHTKAKARIENSGKIHQDKIKIMSKKSMSSQSSQSDDNPIVNDFMVQELTNNFMVQKTEIPDLYKLFDNNNKFVENACIDTLKTSKMLNLHFQNKTMLEKIKFQCTQNTNKHLSTKWIPMHPST